MIAALTHLTHGFIELTRCRTGSGGARSVRRRTGDGSGLGRLPWQASPLAGADPGAGIARDERDDRGVHHAEILADDAAIATVGMLDDDGALEDGTHPNGLTGHHGVEPAADLVVERGDDSRKWN